MLISIERLREIADKVEPIRLSFDDFVSMARELLQRREAERKAASWDDAPEWAIARRRAKGGWIYYPDMAEVQGMSSLWELQERPK